MAPKELLCDVLREYLEKTNTGPTRLAKLSKVPRKTINHWLSGHVVQPRQWQDVIRVAQALHLTEVQADRLLKAAGKDSIRQLQRAAQTEADRTLLAAFDASAGRAPAPFMAPPDLTRFVGRAAELAELKAAVLREGWAAICDVSGMGGVGKTALAVRLAYAVRQEFSDGVLWARLDASDSMTILDQWARKLGSDVSQYRDLESRAAEMRAVLAHKRALLVLDNAENSVQIRPLLPPSDSRCAVVVTTRNNGLNATDGWARLELQPFVAGSGEALRLFEKYLGEATVRAHGSALSEVADLLGHLPLALAIAAGQLSTHTHKHTPSLNGGATIAHTAHAIAALLAQLREANTRLSALQRDDYNVQASFEVSYAALTPGLQHFFVRLGVFGGEDFGPEAVADVNEVSLATATSQLASLSQRSLVQPSSEGRFRLHPLLRDYAREQMGHTFSEEQRAEVYDRMVAFFARSVGSGPDSGPSPNGKTPLPDADRGNVWEALRAVAQLPWKGGASAQRMEALCSFLQQRDAAAKVESHLRRAIECAEAAGDIDGRLTLQMRMVYVRWWRGDDPSDAAEQVLDLALKNDHPSAYEALRLLAMFARMRGDYAASREYYERNLALARRTGQPRQIIRALVGLGDLCCVLENYPDAEQFLEEARQFVTLDTDIRMRILVHQQLGMLRAAQNRFEEAERLLDESIALSRQSRRDDRLLGALGDRADVALMDGNVALDVARACASESLDISRRMGFAHGVSDSLERLGKCARLQGDWSGSQKHLDEALKVATAANIVECKASINFDLAKLGLARGDLRAARDFAQTSLALYGNTHPRQSAKVRAWLAGL